MDRFENGVTLHHIGYVVASISGAAAGFARSLALEWNGKIIHDPMQGARVSFFRAQRAGEPVIELVEPAGEESPVDKFLQRGGGLHHLCYEVDDLDKQLQWVRGNGDLIVRAPTPAVAFDGRPVAWVYTRTRLLTEYLQR